MTTRAAVLSCVLTVLAGGCTRAADPTPAREVLVLVVIVVPADLGIERFRFRKIIADADAGAPKNVPFDGGADASMDERTTGVLVPSNGTVVTLAVEGIAGGRVVAAATKDLSATTTMSEVTLARCVPAVLVSDELASCGPVVEPYGHDADVRAEVADAIDAGTDAGDVIDAMDDVADVSEEPDVEFPRVCADPSDGGRPAKVMRPATVRPACATYCTSMQANCPEVYQTEDRCLFACEAIGWPVGVDSDNEDSINCRTNFARAAGMFGEMSLRDERCRKASIDSIGACGLICEVYCHTGQRICPGFFPPEPTCTTNCLDRENTLHRDFPKNAFHGYLSCRLGFLADAVFDPSGCYLAAPNNQCLPCPGFKIPLN